MKIPGAIFIIGDEIENKVDFIFIFAEQIAIGAVCFLHRFHRTRACAPARAKSRLAASNMNEINKKFSKTNGFMGRGEP